MEIVSKKGADWDFFFSSNNLVAETAIPKSLSNCAIIDLSCGEIGIYTAWDLDTFAQLMNVTK